MKREIFTEKIQEVTDEQIIQSDTMMLEAVDKWKNLYSEFGDEMLTKRLLQCIYNNLQSIQACTKALRGTMKDIPNASVYSELPEPGLRITVISIEELAELAMTLVEKIDPDREYHYEDGLQEFADVCVCMDVIENALGINPDSTDVDKAIYVKSKRVLDSFNKTGTYN